MHKEKTICALPVESQDQSFSLNHNLNFSLKSHVYGDHHPDIAFDGNLLIQIEKKSFSMTMNMQSNISN